MKVFILKDRIYFKLERIKSFLRGGVKQNDF